MENVTKDRGPADGLIQAMGCKAETNAKEVGLEWPCYSLVDPRGGL